MKVMVWNMNSNSLTDEDLTAQPLGPQKSWGIFLWRVEHFVDFPIWDSLNKKAPSWQKEGASPKEESKVKNLRETTITSRSIYSPLNT